MVSVFLAYVGYIWSKYGIQKSISESYYVLPEKENWLFVAFTWLFAFPAMILGNSLLMLFAGGGILYLVFQDIAPLSKEPNDWIPASGASIGFVIGMIGQKLLI